MQPTAVTPRKSGKLPLIIGIIIAGLLILVGGLTVVDRATANTRTITTALENRFDKLVLDIGTADVLIIADETDAHLTATSAHGILNNRGATYRSTFDGTTLTVTQREPFGLQLSTGYTREQLELHLGANQLETLNITIGSGTLDIKTGATDSTVISGSADVLFTAAASTLNVSTGSGNIDATTTGDAETVTLTSKSGNTTLNTASNIATLTLSSGSGNQVSTISGNLGTYTATTDSGNHLINALGGGNSITAKSGSGNSTVVVPNDTYQVRTRTGSGTVAVTVDQARDAERIIDVTTGSGNITITGS